VVRRLQERLAAEPAEARPAAKLLILGQPDVALIDAMGEYERLLVMDAVRSGAPPGTLHRVDWTYGSVEARGVARASSHGLGVRKVLELAAAMSRLPALVERLLSALQG
jgi:hydrogenase maturation protease